MGFQVPRVTIKIDFKEGASFGELSLISFGYGLHQAWIYSSMFDKGGIFGTGGLQAGPFNDQLSLAYFVSILIYGLLLLIASILDTKLIRALHATPTLVAAALLGATGTLLLLGSGAESPFDGSTLQIISGILTGTGSSILLLAWGIAFSRRDSASIIINGALSIAIGFGIYGLVLHQIPFPWGGVASALIPFAEIALLLVLRRHVSLDFDNRQLFFQPLPINHARFVMRFGLPVFFLGVALGIMRQTSIETILPGSAFEDQALLFVTACVATVLIMVTFLALGGDERWHIFFRPLIPFIAVTAIFIPFTTGGTSFWGTSVVLVGYMSFEALMWIFFSELSQRFRLSPIFVFGLGRGVMALAALGGSTLPLFTGALGTPTGLGEMGTVLIVLVAMMLAYALLPDEHEMGRYRCRDAEEGRRCAEPSPHPAHRGERGGRANGRPRKRRGARDRRCNLVGAGRGLRPRRFGRPRGGARGALRRGNHRKPRKRPAGARCRRRGNRRRGRRRSRSRRDWRCDPRPLPGPPGHGLLALHLH